MQFIARQHRKQIDSSTEPPNNHTRPPFGKPLSNKIAKPLKNVANFYFPFRTYYEGMKMRPIVQILLGTSVLGICAVIEVFAIVTAAEWLTRLRRLGTAMHYLRRTVFLIATFVLVVAIHTVQIWIWAAALVLFGAFPPTSDAIYFALVTYTTVGYGDVLVDEGFRIFGAMAGVTGVLAFGLSTAFLVGLLSPLFHND
jgi:hypothetical protein